jgi:hypothetical protein
VMGRSRLARPRRAAAGSAKAVAPFGGPEPQRAGGLGGGAPHSPAAGRPNLDTRSGTSRRSKPPRPALFRPVHLTSGEYRRRAASELELLAQHYVPRGKRRRSFKRKASDFRRCGQDFLGQKCNVCGFVKGKILVECGLRICPDCSRYRSQKYVRNLRPHLMNMKRRRGMDFYLVTYTLRFAPDSEEDLSVEGLRSRREVLLSGIRCTWKRYLRHLGDHDCRSGMLFSVEVSPGGLVHAHAIFYGRRPNEAKLKMLYAEKAGDSPVLNIRYIRGNVSKALKEVVKYLTKGASPARRDVLRGSIAEYTDPKLAARVEVAFSGAHLLEKLGSFRGISDEDEDEAPRTEGCRCPICKADDWSEMSGPLARVILILPFNWRPNFAKKVPPLAGLNRT